VMFVLVNRDLELTCDEAVVRRFGTQTKTAYAYTLIGLAEFKNKLKLRGNFAPLCNGFSRNATEERIRAIMETKTKSKIRTFVNVSIGTALVALLTLGVLAASATESDTPDATPDDVLGNAVESTQATATEASSVIASPDDADEPRGGLDIDYSDEQLDIWARQSALRQHLFDTESEFRSNFNFVDPDSDEIQVIFFGADGELVLTGRFCPETDKIIWDGELPEGYAVSVNGDNVSVTVRISE